MDRIAAVWPEYLLFEPRLYEPGSHAVIGHCGFPAELKKKKGRLRIYLFIYRSRPTFFFTGCRFIEGFNCFEFDPQSRRRK